MTQRITGPGPNPSGLCQCGCGLPAPIAPESNRRYGWVAGQPKKFIIGHNGRRSPVDYIVNPATGCWEWQHARSSSGYGRKTVSGNRQVQAHRYYWEQVHGPVPEALCVLHKCDNRACVNPDHLFLGTKGDNSRDMMSKGRGCVGERQGGHKLTREQVEEIRQRLDDGDYHRTIAKDFGVSRSCIGKIANGLSWSL